MSDKTNESLNAIGKLLEKMTTKSIPLWDIDEHEESIKTHITRFENAIGTALELTDEEKAMEFKATLRGFISEYVEELCNETKNNYTKLKEELLQTFNKEKTTNMLIKEFNSLRWRKKKQTIREFAAVLNIQWRKIIQAANDNDENKVKSEAILKNRLIEALKDEDQQFGSQFEFFINDSSAKSFKDLAKLAEIKYDQYFQNKENIQESKWDDSLNDSMFFNISYQDMPFDRTSYYDNRLSRKSINKKKYADSNKHFDHIQKLEDSEVYNHDTITYNSGPGTNERGTQTEIFQPITYEPYDSFDNYPLEEFNENFESQSHLNKEQYEKFYGSEHQSYSDEEYDGFASDNGTYGYESYKEYDSYESQSSSEESKNTYNDDEYL